MLPILAIAAALATSRPNVVFVRVDDMRYADLLAVRPDDGERVLENVHDLLAAHGTTFEASFVSYPLCAPSRASILSGQYVHNHRVYGNSGSLGGFQAFDHANALPVWLRTAGYYTVFVGKYMNSTQHWQPAGWDEYAAFTTFGYYDYAMLENGVEVTYGHAPADYSTDVITGKAVEFILSRRNAERPFCLFVDYFAPHKAASVDGGFPPAPRHQGILSSYAPVHGPAYDELDVSDKPASIQGLPLLSQAARRGIDLETRGRLGTLLAVNEGIGAIVDALREEDVLEHTLVLFTSDNGSYGGEHRIPGGKEGIYEEAARVPLIVRGPRVRAGAVVPAIVANVDVAPTICALAGAAPTIPVDGLSLVPLLEGALSTWDRPILLESYDYALSATVPTRTVTAIRFPGGIYAEHDHDGDGGIDDRELYDLVSDPFEMSSLHGDPTRAIFMARRAADLRALRDCVGASCW